ncbi:MAG TPA: Stp1/IreP family PP2C-type Ser/Thr phosphatase [Acidimicrobiia bacterium]
MRLVSGASTDKGQVRAVNEDGYIVDRRLQLFAVADGMGGHRAGDIASATALEALRAEIAGGAQLERAIGAANLAVFEKSSSDDSMQGMGTTVTAAMPGTASLNIGHVGDSRAYLLRDGDFSRITTDHSLVEELVQDGSLTEEQAAIHPQRSIVTRALGVDRAVEVDLYSIQLRDHDRVLLCSDGLTTMLRNDDIASVLRREQDPTKAANALVDAANEAGGEDNITTIVIDVHDDGDVVPQSRAHPAVTDAEDDGNADAGPGGAPGQPSPEAVGPEPAASAAQALPAAPEPTRELGVDSKKVALSFGRLLLFAVPIVLIIGLAVGAVAWYARRTYYVAFDRTGKVVAYQGRPGGVLLWNPTVLRKTSLTRPKLTDEAVAAIDDQKAFSNKGEVNAYLAALDAEVAATTTTTTTTIVTLPPTAKPTTTAHR